MANLTTGNFGENTWPLKASEYEVEPEILGQGASATVHKAVCKVSKQTCAIKKIDLEQTRDESAVQKEIKTLSSFKNENITAYYGCFLNKSKLWILMELMDGESVASVINLIDKKRRNEINNAKNSKQLSTPIINEITMAIILKEVLAGLAYLHDENCIHRDIKAQNILMNRSGAVKLADFGVSCLLSGAATGPKARPKTFVGTPCWMAPEVGDVEKHINGYDSKADMWSFGITCVEMVTGKPPYFEFPSIKVILMTIQSPPINPKTHCEEKGFKISSQLAKMIEYCLKKLPKDRPTAKVLSTCGFIKKALNIKDPKSYISGLVKNEMKDKPPAKVVRTRASKDASGQWTFNLDDTSDDDQEYFNQENNINSGNSTQAQTSPEYKNNTSTTSPQTNTSNIANGTKINLTLRIRTDFEGQLNDIKFPFVMGTDTADSLAHELCEAQLVNISDKIRVAEALTNVIHSGEQTFMLDMGNSEIEAVYEDLIGFARLSLDTEAEE